jgi:hypothetical protein
MSVSHLEDALRASTRRATLTFFPLTDLMKVYTKRRVDRSIPRPLPPLGRERTFSHNPSFLPSSMSSPSSLPACRAPQARRERGAGHAENGGGEQGGGGSSTTRGRGLVLRLVPAEGVKRPRLRTVPRPTTRPGFVKHGGPRHKRRLWGRTRRRGQAAAAAAKVLSKTGEG